MEVGTAFAVSVVAGGALGALVHAQPRLRRALDPLLASWYAVPFFVFYPLLVALFGLNALPLIAIGVIFAAPAMMLSTLAGLDRVPRVMRKVARVHRLSRVQEVRLITLPSAAPHLFTGLKLAFAYSFIGIIAGEFILSGGGLGYGIAYAYESFEDRKMYALMLFVLLIATGVNGALHVWDGRLARRSGSDMMRLFDAIAIVAAILAIWLGLYAYAGDVAITSPWRTFAFAGELFSRASFWNHVGATMAAFAMALAISAIGGVALGLVLGIRRFAGEVAEPILSSFYTIPKVTLYPVMLLIFGLGMSAKVAFGVIHGMIPVMLFTIAAVKNVQPVLLRTARALRLNPAQTALSVLAPAVTPEIITGLRVGFALTLLGVLIGEMFASQRGLGFLIINGIEVHDVRMMTTVTLIVVIFAVAANGLMLALDRRAHRFA